ncbi:uncharacterized protein N7458_006224 [Penicillium daleae]|uniref:Uncharacterized protein n=1 Tax=Penicillium daleae TaxID=63821 RepID=A0AAD6C4A5_9EURO|nr:uncharacterized protein N7458_006224 [Penicillium daleae]KAJ5449775.1 hypothetical protein N7458_006224 [Penicillium daleae]
MVAIMERHSEEKGFWVEEGPATVFSGKLMNEIGCRPIHLGEQKLYYLIFPFVDDTGADFMTLMESDIIDLIDNNQQNDITVAFPNRINVIQIQTITGTDEFLDHHRMEVALADGNGDLIDVLMVEDPLGPTPNRVNGPWIRYKLHMANAPTATATRWIFRNKTALANGTAVGIPVANRVLPP